jgi:hypothetical protein
VKIVAIGVALVFAGSVAGSSGELQVTAPSPATTVPYAAANFKPVDPARPDGPQIAVLRGDPDTGPSSMLMRMPKLAGILHYHTADYELVVIEGQMRHWIEGQLEEQTPVLGPGSYWFQRKMQPHTDSCLSERCVMFLTWAGKRDAVRASTK